MAGLQGITKVFTKERSLDLGFYFPLLSIQDHFVNVSKSGGSLVSNMICRGGLIVQAVVSAAAMCFRMLTTIFSLFFSNVRDQALNFSATALHAAAAPIFFLAAFLPNQEMQAVSLFVRVMMEPSDKKDQILKADTESFNNNHESLIEDLQAFAKEVGITS